MNTEHLRLLLESHVKGEVSTEDALSRLKTLSFENLGYAKIDHHRKIRNGYPEVIYGEGKTPEQVVAEDRALSLARRGLPGARTATPCRA